MLLSILVLLCECGGTGKTTCINDVCGTLGKNEDYFVATTGKAANVIEGSGVLNKKSGMDLPMVNILTNINSQKLRDIQ